MALEILNLCCPGAGSVECFFHVKYCLFMKGGRVWEMDGLLVPSGIAYNAPPDYWLTA